MKYIPAPPVSERNRSQAFSSSLHSPNAAYSSNWLTQPSKSTFLSYFSGRRLNYLFSSPLCSSLSLTLASTSRPEGNAIGVDARKLNLMVAFSEAASALTPSFSYFSLKCTSESEFIVVAIIVHVRCRSNTAATSLTNVF